MDESIELDRRALTEQLEGRRLLSGTVTTLATFSAADGFNPDTLAVDAAGNIYGSTATAVIEIAAGTHEQSTIATFPANAIAVDDAGNVFVGRANGLFEISASAHVMSQLPVPAAVTALVAGPAGNIYGLAWAYNNSASEVFSVSAVTHSVSALSGFNADAGGFGPYDLTRDAAGDLYWLAPGDGPVNVIALAAGSSTPISVYFGFEVGEIATAPAGNVIFVDNGTVLRAPAQSAAVTTLVLPHRTWGGGSVVDDRGYLFGTAFSADPKYPSEIFKVATGQECVHSAASLGSLGAGFSSGDLIADADGNLYGTIEDAAGNASIFEASGTGFVAGPSAPVVLDEPTSETGIESAQASFTASVGSVPAPSVRWQVSTDGGKTFSDIFGNASATTPTLVLTGLTTDQNGARYRAVFSTSLGTVATQSARLAVVPLGLVSAAHASPSKASGTSTTLSALGDSANGEAGLTYAWSIVRSPAGAATPSFSANGTNAARHNIVTFHKSGDYLFRCTATDGRGDTVKSDVQVEVSPEETSLRLTPHDRAIAVGKDITFDGTVYDQFGHPILYQPPIDYSVISGPGTIDPYTGVFSSPLPGAALIEASDGDLSGTAGLQVVP